MQIFLDTSKRTEIEKWLAQGVIDGVTTNPSIMLKDGQRDLEATVKEIAGLVNPGPMSVEVLTGEPREMVRLARLFSRWADNIAVKITVIGEDGRPHFDVIKELECDGIAVNCTAIMSLGQVMLAAKAGATYVSIFQGRINDEGNDGPAVVRVAREWLDTWGYKSKIIAASVRSVMDVQQAALARTHVITIPPAQMAKLADHQYTRATVQQFLRDAVEGFSSNEIEGLLKAA